MKEYITRWTFANRMRDSFSQDGALALFEYYENMEEETGEEIEFDPVAIRGDWTEYEDIDEALKDYKDYEDLEELKDNVEVIEVEGSDRLIVASY